MSDLVTFEVKKDNNEAQPYISSFSYNVTDSPIGNPSVFGRVFKATDNMQGTNWIIKHANSPEYHPEFEIEYNILNDLSKRTEHTPQPIYLIERTDTPTPILGLAMPYYGTTFRSQLKTKEENHLEFERFAIEYLIQYAQLLNSLHKNGQVCTDRKEDDLFIKDDGTLVVIDWNALRDISDLNAERTVTGRIWYNIITGYQPRPDMYPFDDTLWRRVGVYRPEGIISIGLRIILNYLLTVRVNEPYDNLLQHLEEWQAVLNNQQSVDTFLHQPEFNLNQKEVSALKADIEWRMGNNNDTKDRQEALAKLTQVNVKDPALAEKIQLLPIELEHSNFDYNRLKTNLEQQDPQDILDQYAIKRWKWLLEDLQQVDTRGEQRDKLIDIVKMLAHHVSDDTVDGLTLALELIQERPHLKNLEIEIRYRLAVLNADQQAAAYQDIYTEYHNHPDWKTLKELYDVTTGFDLQNLEYPNIDSLVAELESKLSRYLAYPEGDIYTQVYGDIYASQHPTDKTVPPRLDSSQYIEYVKKTEHIRQLVSILIELYTSVDADSILRLYTHTKDKYATDYSHWWESVDDLFQQRYLHARLPELRKSIDMKDYVQVETLLNEMWSVGMDWNNKSEILFKHLYDQLERLKNNNSTFERIITQQKDDVGQALKDQAEVLKTDLKNEVDKINSGLDNKIGTQVNKLSEQSKKSNKNTRVALGVIVILSLIITVVGLAPYISNQNAQFSILQERLDSLDNRVNLYQPEDIQPDNNNNTDSSDDQLPADTNNTDLNTDSQPDNNNNTDSSDDQPPTDTNNADSNTDSQPDNNNNADLTLTYEASAAIPTETSMPTAAPEPTTIDTAQQNLQPITVMFDTERSQVDPLPADGKSQGVVYVVIENLPTDTNLEAIIQPQNPSGALILQTYPEPDNTWEITYQAGTIEETVDIQIQFTSADDSTEISSERYTVTIQNPLPASTPTETSIPTAIPVPTEALDNGEWKQGIVRTNPPEFSLPTVQTFSLNTSYPSQSLTISIRRVTQLDPSLFSSPELQVNGDMLLNESTPATVATDESGMLEFNVSATSGAGLIELAVSIPQGETLQSWVFPVAETVSFSSRNQGNQTIWHDEWKANYAIDLTGDVYFGYANTLQAGYERHASHPYYVLSTTPDANGRVPVISQVAIASDTFSVTDTSITANVINPPATLDIASDQNNPRTYATAALEPIVEQRARVVFSMSSANGVSIPNTYVYPEPTTIAGSTATWYTGYVAGWVNANYLNLDTQAVASTAQTATFNGQTLNIRSGPSTDFEQIGRLTTGQSIEIIAVTSVGDWYKIQYNGSEAWINNQSINIDNTESLPIEDPPTPTPTTEAPNVNLSVADNGIIISPWPLVCGQESQVRVNITNTGTETIQNSGTILIEAVRENTNDVLETTYTNSGAIAAGTTVESATANLTVSTYYNEYQFIRVTLDSDKQITESNEDDNVSNGISYILGRGTCG